MSDPTTSVFLNFDNDVNDVLSLRPLMEGVPSSSSSTDVASLNRRRKRDAGMEENGNAKKKVVKKETASSSTAVSRSSPYYGLYSGTGFDMLRILAQVASRPNPTVNLGPIDMSSSFIVTSATDPDFPIVYASQTFENLTGYKSAEIVGKNCRFLQSPDGIVQRGALRQFVDNNIVYQLKTSVDSRMECQYININYKKGGQPFVNLITIIPICNAQGNPTFFVGFQVDLMQQAGAILRTLEDNSYVIDLNNMPAVNGPSASQFLGAAPPVDGWRSPKNITAKSDANGLPHFPSDVSGLTLIDDDDILDRFLAMDAAAAAATPSSSSSKNGADEPGSYEPDGADASESYPPPQHQRSDPRVEQSQATMDHLTFTSRSSTHYDLIQNAADFIHILSSRGIILFASSAATSATLGYEPGDLLGQNISEYCHPADFTALMRDLKATAVDDSVSAAYRFRKRDGTYVALDVTGHKYEMNNKKRTRCVVLSGRERDWGSLTQRVLMNPLAPVVPDIPLREAQPSQPPSAIAPDLWAKVTKTGLIIYIAPNSYPVFGTLLTPPALYGQNLLDYVYEGDRARVAARLFNERRYPFAHTTTTSNNNSNDDSSNHNGSNVNDSRSKAGVDVRCSVESAGRFLPAIVTAFPSGTPAYMFVQVALSGRTHPPPPPAHIPPQSTSSSTPASSSSSDTSPPTATPPTTTPTPANHYYDPNLDIFAVATTATSSDDASLAAGLQCEINNLRLGNSRLRQELEAVRKMPQLANSTGMVA